MAWVCGQYGLIYQEHINDLAEFVAGGKPNPIVCQDGYYPYNRTRHPHNKTRLIDFENGYLMSVSHPEKDCDMFLVSILTLQQNGHYVAGEEKYRRAADVVLCMRALAIRPDAVMEFIMPTRPFTCAVSYKRLGWIHCHPAHDLT